jgi:hypothetical protein
LELIFEVIKDGFYEGTLTKEDFFIPGEELMFHVFLETCDELQASTKEFQEEFLVDIALIPKE